MTKSSMEHLTLYIGSGCPFCTKVTNFLAANHIELAIKDVWSDRQLMDELIALTGKTQVPCLKIDKVGLLESNDIIAYLKQTISRKYA